MQVREALDRVKEEMGIPNPGMPAKAPGWSSLQRFLRCSEEYRLYYLVKENRGIVDQGTGYQQLGIIVHDFLAEHYRNGPDRVREFKDKLIDLPSHVESFLEAWRIYEGYRDEYMFDWWKKEDVFAVEEWGVLQNPTFLTRVDLIIKLKKNAIPGFAEGYYIVDHKTASKFDYASLNCWYHDVEIITQQMAWYDKIDLKGTIINLVGKQKKQKFERPMVHCMTEKFDWCKEFLKEKIGQMQLYKSTDHYWEKNPQGCVDRKYGVCGFYSTCWG